ncbi:MAG: DUF4097 family beta strand repeat-containing protein [Candidatus Aminicenantales bacterium]
MPAQKAGLIAAAVLALSFGASGRNLPIEQITVPLSSPGRPGILIVNHDRGAVTVTGYDGAVVVVKAAPSGPDDSGAPDERANGMKKIAAGKIRLSALENDNAVTVISDSASKTIDLDILVPRRFDLKISVRDNGAVRIDGVAGEMEINNLNGPVQLDRLSGSAIVNTVDGDLTCRFDRISPGLPLAFTSIYGKIDVTFPPDADLTVKMKTDQGSIFSDFDIVMDQRKSVSEPADKKGGLRVSLEDWTTGKIGRGGTDVLLKSYEGNIYIRKGRAGRP